MPRYRMSVLHPQSRWGRRRIKGVYEVAASEVACPWRGRGIGIGLLRTALTPERDERILLGSLDPEDWDTLGMGHDPSRLSLLQINQLPREEREAIYRRLIPEAIFTTFQVDAVAFTDPAGNRLVDFCCPPDEGMVQIGVRARPQDPDWCYLIRLQTAAYNEIELAFVIISDPRSERFAIDRDLVGQDTYLGTKGRNLPEENRAMRAGLAPGQTRRGLGLLRQAVRLVDEFAGWSGHALFALEAMFYHNAIVYERYGFDYEYSVRREEMERVHREFQPGGALYARLDSSIPFRQPGAEKTVRGRSWAIHDGILGEPWRVSRLYKRVGEDRGVCTFPDATW